MIKRLQKIGVMAPSSYVELSDIEQSKLRLEELGIDVFIHPQTLERYNQSAGTNAQKHGAFLDLWHDNTVDAIWAAGGGNRALHFTSLLKTEDLHGSSKPVIGYSDVTVLLNYITAFYDQPTIHGSVFSKVYNYPYLDDLLALLRGNAADITFDTGHANDPAQTEGKLVGGNLSLIQYASLMLPSSYWEDGLLFIEDCNEELSRIDRMFWALKQRGIFARINGLILGEFTDLKDTGRRPYGFTLRDIVNEHLSAYNIPVFSGAPFGHGTKLFPLTIGSYANVSADHKGSTLKILSQ